MLAAPGNESLAVRFAPYLQELRDLFASRSLPCGHPEDLQRFASRLQEPAFHEEMLSMARSILYREPHALSRGEWMELFALAASGPQPPDTLGGYDGATRQLFQFVSGLLQAQRHGMLPAAEYAESPASLEAPPAEAFDLAPETHLPAGILTPDEPAPTLPDDALLPDITTPPHSPELPDSDVLAPADSPTLDAAAPVAVSPALPHQARLVPVWGEASVLPQPQSLRLRLRNAYWLPGLCALLLALALVAILRRHPAAPSPTQAATAQPAPIVRAPAIAAAAKPSAYGPTLSAAPAAIGAQSAPAAPASAHHQTPPPLSPRTHAHLRRQPDPDSPARDGLGAHDLPSPDLREGVFLASSGLMASHLLYAPAPGYPRLANFTRVHGQVIVQVVVSRNGTVASTHVLEGPMLLRGAAEHAIRRWRYRPYLIDGKPTDVATIVTVTFQLRH